METRQKVWFFGNSLLLAGIQASMRACPRFEVIVLNEPALEPAPALSGPKVVIFELGGIQPESLLAQLQAQPGLLLIGIDPESHEVLLTGQAARAITLDQIAQIVRINPAENARPTCPGG